MHSLTSGDLDEDGYGDIVIGTPYDSEVVILKASRWAIKW